jgi:hypothetical protein
MSENDFPVHDMTCSNTLDLCLGGARALARAGEGSRYSSDYAIVFISHVRFEVFTVVTMKNVVFWMLRHVALERTDVSEELSASIIRMTLYFFVACIGC